MSMTTKQQWICRKCGAPYRNFAELLDHAQGHMGDHDAILDAAFHGECLCGAPLAWTVPNEEHISYGSCSSPMTQCETEIAKHVLTGRMEVA